RPPARGFPGAPPTLRPRTPARGGRMSAYGELFNPTQTYPRPRGPTVAGRDFNLTMARGELACVSGHSAGGTAPGRSTPAGLGAPVVVRDFNLTVARGEFVCLIGHSGCGKSTVLSMLAGLSSPSSGGIILAGRELTGPGPDRGVVFQSPSLLPWLTALENVLLGVRRVFPTATRTEQRQIAEYHLSLVGLAESLNLRPAELSQGMRQRVGIARAFALKPRM